MTNFNQGYLPFSVQVNANGTCSSTPDLQEETQPLYPHVERRRIRNPKHPEIAFYPDAIAYCVNKFCAEYARPMTTGMLQIFLKGEGFPKMNNGNITNAVNSMLITRLGIKDFQKSKRGEQLFASNELGEDLNNMIWEYSNWIEHLEDGTETPFYWSENRLTFMSNLVRSIKQCGTNKIKDNSQPVSDPHAPF